MSFWLLVSINVKILGDIDRNLCTKFKEQTNVFVVQNDVVINAIHFFRFIFRPNKLEPRNPILASLICS